MLKLFRRTPRDVNFWEWLDANTSQIQSDPGETLRRMSKKIGRAFRASYPGLSWEITPAPSPPWHFCVSANGNRDLFPRVEQAVREAPELAGWTVQAFRQRGPLTAEIDVGESTLGYEDIWCSVTTKDGAYHVALMIKGLSREVDAILSTAALILLDNAVGEYDATTKIQQLDRGPLPPNPERRDNFFPLSELPEFLDRTPGV